MLEIAHSYRAIGYFGSKETAWHHRLSRSHTSIEKNRASVGNDALPSVLRGAFLPHEARVRREALSPCCLVP
jgi:hypothetical protein